MKDWIQFIKDKVNSDLWGFLALDYYYQNRASGLKEEPKVYIDRLLLELDCSRVDPVAFHYVLVNVCVHLLGNDFTETFDKSIKFIESYGGKLDYDQLQAISQHFAVYGKKNAFRRTVKKKLPDYSDLPSEGNGRGEKNVLISKERDETLQTKTILELDLVAYSDVALTLEENLDALAVEQLNKQIKGFVIDGLKELGREPQEIIMATTGDGAILAFDSAEDAHLFARVVHNTILLHNKKKSLRSAKRWFRMGAATGEISMKQKQNGGFDIAGNTIARAVRLEAASRPGELLIDHETFEILPDSYQNEYGAEEEVPGKRSEKFRVRRCVIDQDVAAKFKRADIPIAIEPSGERREILNKLNGLNPIHLDDLIFLLEIPVGYIPPQTLTAADRKTAILTWQHGEDGLEKLELELDYLLRRNRPSEK